MPHIRTLGLLSLAVCLYAQSGPAPRFEVASIKPTPPERTSGSSGITTKRDRLLGENVTLKRCLMGAFSIGPTQIVGGPPWLDSDRFEIAAKADRPVNDDAIFMTMLQSLLVERFQLAFHRETRDMEAMLLEIGRTGSRMEKSPDCESSTSSSNGRIEARCTSMDLFARVLSRSLGMPVVNHTGLDGQFNFILAWSPESDRPLRPGEAPADTGLSVFTAIQQLGLRLQHRRTPVEVLVIDHTERPSAN